VAGLRALQQLQITRDLNSMAGFGTVGVFVESGGEGSTRWSPAAVGGRPARKSSAYEYCTKRTGAHYYIVSFMF
jgi:hypothetical protein